MRKLLKRLKHRIQIWNPVWFLNPFFSPSLAWMNEHQDMTGAFAHGLQVVSTINLNIPQPPPQENKEPIVWDLVIQDMRERDEKGVQKYHTHLQPFNGRDALVDAYQEALDLAVYLRQLIYEKYKE